MRGQVLKVRRVHGVRLYDVPVVGSERRRQEGEAQKPADAGGDHQRAEARLHPPCVKIGPYPGPGAPRRTMKTRTRDFYDSNVERKKWKRLVLDSEQHGRDARARRMDGARANGFKLQVYFTS